MSLATTAGGHSQLATPSHLLVLITVWIRAIRGLGAEQIASMRDVSCKGKEYGTRLYIFLSAFQGRTFEWVEILRYQAIVVYMLWSTLPQIEDEHWTSRQSCAAGLTVGACVEYVGCVDCLRMWLCSSNFRLLQPTRRDKHNAFVPICGVIDAGRRLLQRFGVSWLTQIFILISELARNRLATNGVKSPWDPMERTSCHSSHTHPWERYHHCYERIMLLYTTSSLKRDETRQSPRYVKQYPLALHT